MEDIEESRKQVCRYTSEDRLAYQQIVDQGMTGRDAARQLGFAVSTAAKWLQWETVDASSKTQAPVGRLPHPGRGRYHQLRDDEFMLTDPLTGEIAFSFPLPMRALHVRNRYVASYSIQGVQMANPSKRWGRNHAEYAEQFAQSEVDLPEVFT